jgi:hypothetical protein
VIGLILLSEALSATRHTCLPLHPACIEYKKLLKTEQADCPAGQARVSAKAG